MNKNTITLVIAVIFALAGWILFLQKPSGSNSEASDAAVEVKTAPSVADNAADANQSAAELAALEAEKAEAIRMAELQIQQCGSLLAFRSQNFDQNQPLNVSNRQKSPMLNHGISKN